MIFLLTIPVIIFMTFWDLVGSNFPPCYQCAGRSFLGWCFLIAVGCFISGLISIVPVGIAAFIGSLPDTHGVEDKTFPLVTLRERDGVHGQFYFLGAGQISDRQYYFWYRRQGDAVVGGKTIREPGVRIYEDGQDSPRMTTFKTAYVNPGVGRWLWLVGMDVRDEERWFPDFHIPPGSIKEGYSL